MKTAIVYFSLEGNTRLVASKLAEALSADLIELRTVKPYPSTGAKKFLIGGKSSTFKEKPELEKYSFDPAEYELVIVGSPLWAWNIAPPLRSFLVGNDLSGSSLAAFICSGGGNPSKAFASIRELAGKPSLLHEAAFVNASSSDIEAAVRDFCEKIK